MDSLEDDIISILYIAREISVYKIPPLRANEGHRANDWGDLANPLWKGRLRIVSKVGKAALLFEDSQTGDLFARADYDPLKPSVDAVLDSSRYFVVRVEEAGRKAYIGMGFAERTDSFDFNVALQDFTKRAKAALNPPSPTTETPSPHIPSGPKKDYSLKEGQTFTISIPGKSNKSGGASLLASSGSATSSGGIPLLPPPPGRRIPPKTTSSLARRSARWATVGAQRGLVQPSGAERARIVDVPPSYKEGHLTPRPDMLGFKLAHPARENAATQKTRPIYLDMQATTPVDPRVLDAMLPYLTDQFGNPHSRTHAYGWEAEQAVEDARKHVADLIGAEPKDIVFTSGATESNNMSIKGVARFNKDKKKHIITTQTEHKCVLDSCRKLSEEGFDITYLPVQSNGVVDLQTLEAAIRQDTSLVSIMTINNETGVIQPMKEIGAILRKSRGVYLHTDAAQAVGKVPIDVNEANIDLMSISGHKIYGPKGVGVAYVRRRPRVRLEPILSGGGQERGLRSGTLPAALAVGMGEAARIAKLEMARDHARIKQLSDRLLHGINSQVEHVDIALSSGSACTSASLEPSYVLRALGAAEDMAHSSLRFGIGRFTTEAEIDFVVNHIVRVVNRLRDMSPLWEMVQEGIDINSINWSQH
ncbi:pyridoxal phosphate-dependent transferase [Chiua virens]|nr:pyridoxal phosphate-dependent transferase [Chiua virens]